MRLTAREIDAIKAAAREAFGPGAVVRLFGSRVDDARRGGDVDLHFEVDGTVPDYVARYRFENMLESAFDGRKIDTVFSVRGHARTGFERIVYRDGIVL
jgi:hypothetical protein